MIHAIWHILNATIKNRRIDRFMSGVFDKKTEKVNRREERELKELKEKRKIRRIATIVLLVFVLLVGGALFINSKYIRRALPAITIGSKDFSAVEFDYFYNNAYKEYESYFSTNFGDYAASYLPNTDAPHSSQTYNEETGESWADYFNDYTITQLTELVQYYTAAKEAGFTISQDVRETIENEIANYRQYAEMYGYPSLDAFLQAAFENYTNEKSLRGILDFVGLASSYSEYIMKSFTYSPEELAEYYSENKDSLDSFTYRYFLYRAETVSSEDYETDEEYEAANSDALAAANEESAVIVADIESEEDFIAAAREYSEEEFENPDSTLKIYPGSWLGDTYGPWLQEEERVYGDVTAIDTTNGTYIIYFVNRDPNEYLMVEMNQILITRPEYSPDDFEAGEDDPEYQELVGSADQDARERAEDVMNLFIERGATKEALLDMMEEYSDDSVEEGFYDSITMNSANNKKPPEIEEWLFTPGRQIGDYELIRTEESGYHIVYFAGYGDRYCDYLADQGMREADYNAWKESLPEVQSEKHWAFMFASH